MVFAVAALRRKAMRSRESAQTARRLYLETRPAALAVLWKSMAMTSRSTAGEFLMQVCENSSPRTNGRVGLAAAHSH